MPDGEPVKAEAAKKLASEAKFLTAAQAAIAKLPAGPRTMLATYLNRLSTNNWGE